MSDFMKWLYANYIGPQVKTASQEDYEMHLSLLENCLEPDLAVSYKNTQEFTASLKVVGDVSFVAGMTVKLKGFQKFDRKYKVTQAKHSLTGGYTVDLSLKQVLEGY